MATTNQHSRQHSLHSSKLSCSSPGPCPSLGCSRIPYPFADLATHPSSLCPSQPRPSSPDASHSSHSSPPHLSSCPCLSSLSLISLLFLPPLPLSLSSRVKAALSGPNRSNNHQKSIKTIQNVQNPGRIDPSSLCLSRRFPPFVGNPARPSGNTRPQDAFGPPLTSSHFGSPRRIKAIKPRHVDLILNGDHVPHGHGGMRSLAVRKTSPLHLAERVL